MGSLLILQNGRVRLRKGLYLVQYCFRIPPSWNHPGKFFPIAFCAPTASRARPQCHDDCNREVHLFEEKRLHMRSVILREDAKVSESGFLGEVLKLDRALALVRDKRTTDLSKRV